MGRLQQLVLLYLFLPLFAEQKKKEDIYKLWHLINIQPCYKSYIAATGYI